MCTAACTFSAVVAAVTYAANTNTTTMTNNDNSLGHTVVIH
jgi:hypothetical protein